MVFASAFNVPWFTHSSLGPLDLLLPHKSHKFGEFLFQSSPAFDWRRLELSSTPRFIFPLPSHVICIMVFACVLRFIFKMLCLELTAHGTETIVFLRTTFINQSQKRKENAGFNVRAGYIYAMVWNEYILISKLMHRRVYMQSRLKERSTVLLAWERGV